MPSRMFRLVLLFVLSFGLTTPWMVSSAAEQSAGSASSPSALTAGDFELSGQQGFGDRQNSEPWASIWFKGKLYVGTARAFGCYRTLVARLIINTPYPPDPEVSCPLTPDNKPDPANLPLQAEIWRWTPGTNTWDRVYQSPTIDNPRYPGHPLALDIGYRTMGIFHEADGTDALYVGSATARSLYFSQDSQGHRTQILPPPRILRTTSGDMDSWQPVPQNTGTFLGATQTQVVGFRSMTIHNGKLYVVASSGLNGQGQVYESANPSGGDNNFRRITPAAWDPDPLHPSQEVYEMASYNGSLYLGSGAPQVSFPAKPFIVWKWDGTGTSTSDFRPIIANGGDAPSGQRSQAVVSVRVFDNRLYLGTSVPAEVYRINPDESWDLVVGNARVSGGVTKSPLSGLGAGFNVANNTLIWRMECHEDQLFVGTFDNSTGSRNDSSPPPENTMGFDFFSSGDGASFTQITNSGFGTSTSSDPNNHKYNEGVRTLTSTPYGLFLGAANQYYGLTMWKEKVASGRTAGPFKIYLPMVVGGGASGKCGPGDRG